jgi:hypothetical protein
MFNAIKIVSNYLPYNPFEALQLKCLGIIQHHCWVNDLAITTDLSCNGESQVILGLSCSLKELHVSIYSDNNYCFETRTYVDEHKILKIGKFFIRSKLNDAKMRHVGDYEFFKYLPIYENQVHTTDDDYMQATPDWVYNEILRENFVYIHNRVLDFAKFTLEERLDDHVSNLFRDCKITYTDKPTRCCLIRERRQGVFMLSIEWDYNGDKSKISKYITDESVHAMIRMRYKDDNEMCLALDGRDIEIHFKGYRVKFDEAKSILPTCMMCYKKPDNLGIKTKYGAEMLKYNYTKDHVVISAQFQAIISRKNICWKFWRMHHSNSSKNKWRKFLTLSNFIYIKNTSYTYRKSQDINKKLYKLNRKLKSQDVSLRVEDDICNKKLRKLRSKMRPIIREPEPRTVTVTETFLDERIYEESCRDEGFDKFTDLGFKITDVKYTPIQTHPYINEKMHYLEMNDEGGAELNLNNLKVSCCGLYYLKKKSIVSVNYGEPYTAEDLYLMYLKYHRNMAKRMLKRKAKNTYVIGFDYFKEFLNNNSYKSNDLDIFRCLYQRYKFLSSKRLKKLAKIVKTHEIRVNNTDVVIYESKHVTISIRSISRDYEKLKKMSLLLKSEEFDSAIKDIYDDARKEYYKQKRIERKIAKKSR